MKSESRVLVLQEFEDCRGHKLTLYAIVRGEKGIEHLGMIDGHGNAVARYLSTSRLIDEVRLTVNLSESCNHVLQKIPDAAKQKIKESLRLLALLIREVNRLICADTT